MEFERPDWLWLILAWPLPALAYLAASRRARPAGAVPVWQRHFAPVFLWLACGLLVCGAAGPIVPLALPTDQRTLVLALDVSGSMQAQDVAPNRLAASQAAARTLVAELPAGVRVGVVAYADGAQLVQPPSARRGDVMAAIDSLQLAGGTAIGDGLTVALQALFPDEPGPGEITLTSRAAGSRGSAVRAPGSFPTAAIVLLSDGQNSVGSDPFDAARLVAARGVRVFTIGFGTSDGAIIGVEGATLRVRLDEEGLERIAQMTGGSYFRASSGPQLRSIYAGLQMKLDLQRRDVEVTALFAAGAALLIAVGSGLALAWFGRVA